MHETDTCVTQTLLVQVLKKEDGTHHRQDCKINLAQNGPLFFGCIGLPDIHQTTGFLVEIGAVRHILSGIPLYFWRLFINGRGHCND